MTKLSALFIFLFPVLSYSSPAPTKASEVDLSPTEGSVNHITYFLLQINQALSIDASVDYITQDDSAVAGQDYIQASGTAVIKAGDTSTVIAVEIIGDGIAEDNEVFKLKITNPSGANFPTGVTEVFASKNIIDDDSSINTLPNGVVLIDIPAGIFIMGNNSLKGPQSGQATEHEVTLSGFKMSETEVTNSQYIEFLNAALAKGLIEIITQTTGADAGFKLVVGTSLSSYAEKILYNLSGTRVMKDHDNTDADDNEFTGIIEPENPINIAYIGYNATTQAFYLKNPHDATDFNWKILTNYYNYTNISHTNDTTLLLNDFDKWSELVGWTENSPESATALPNKDTVSDYPVTFIRWWGAYAFAEFYQLKLPTEAQWEYAAKGGSNFTYAVYDGITISNANWNSGSLHPAQHHIRIAKSGQANPFGLYNLGGNVWEWIADHYVAYDSANVTDPLIAVSDSTTRSWRGGSWNYHEATLETSARYFDDENRGNDHFGFRVVDHN